MGSWFLVREEDAHVADGGNFAHKQGVRPLVLATPVGPDARLFPRSTGRPRSTRDWGIEHDAHDHEPELPCVIDLPGWVLLGMEVSVDECHLDQSSYSCEEPEETGLLAEIRKAVAI